MLSLYINNRLAHNSSSVRRGQKLTQLTLEVLNFVNKASVEYFPISLFDLCLTTVKHKRSNLFLRERAGEPKQTQSGVWVAAAKPRQREDVRR